MHLYFNLAFPFNKVIDLIYQVYSRINQCRSLYLRTSKFRTSYYFNKYNKPIRNTILISINVFLILIFMLILLSLENVLKHLYQPAGHIVIVNLKIILNSRIRYIVSKDPKYKFPSYIYFDICREEIASALNDFGNRWCK